MSKDPLDCLSQAIDEALGSDREFVSLKRDALKRLVMTIHYEVAGSVSQRQIAFFGAVTRPIAGYIWATIDDAQGLPVSYEQVQTLSDTALRARAALEDARAVCSAKDRRLLRTWQVEARITARGATEPPSALELEAEKTATWYRGCGYVIISLCAAFFVLPWAVRYWVELSFSVIIVAAGCIIAPIIIWRVGHSFAQSERDRFARSLWHSKRVSGRKQRYALYLRPFIFDRVSQFNVQATAQARKQTMGLEGLVVDALAPRQIVVSIGKASGIGRPGAVHPRDEEWQECFHKLADGASLIVVVCFLQRASAWEIAQLRSNNWQEKTIFVVPAYANVLGKKGREGARRAYESSRQYLATQGWNCPELEDGGLFRFLSNGECRVISPFPKTASSLAKQIAKLAQGI
ncbi:hypothetical protein [Terricaulis sp.]|uniref:hypothetical protein n=1 Tax=Terricaulis sp. TaxID=2768686 RepID=UPI003783D534